MKQKLTIASISSFVLSVIGIIAFILNKEYLGAPAVVREVHNAYGGLSAEAMNIIAVIGIIAGIIFFVLGIVLIFFAAKKEK